MTPPHALRHQWLGNIRGDVLAGLVVALALIPESLAFAFIAGVDPQVTLYASFCIAVVAAIAGGRPAMISAATGAMALVLASLVRDHGPQYLLAATVLTGILQIAAGALRVSVLMRFVSRSVITGFLNALAILIFLAQLPELTNVGWPVYAVTGAGLAILYLLPRVTRAVPSPLVCIVVLTAVAMALGLDIRTVGDTGRLPDSLPTFLWPDVPLTLETLGIVLPYALTLTMVGLLESLLTASIIDDMTDTPSDKHRECRGQGLANITAGFMGGMAGCALVGQSIINVRSGGRGRLSTLLAGVFLLVFVVFFGDWVARIPMAALVALMIMVSIGTFQWSSVPALWRQPVSSSLVMLATVGVVIATHDLARGVLVGVLLSGVFFAHKVSKVLTIHETRDEDTGALRYAVHGQVFFASTTVFRTAFEFHGPIRDVHIDLTHARLWDVSAVGALDAVVMRYRRRGATVVVSGLDADSQQLVTRFGTHDKPGADALAAGH